MRTSLSPRVRQVLVLAAVLIASLCSTGVCQEVVGQPGETPEQRDARMKWWRDSAVFRLFCDDAEKIALSFRFSQ